MRVYKCDACGKIYNRNKNTDPGSAFVQTGIEILYEQMLPSINSTNVTRMHFDLCDDCLKKIKDMMSIN